jgi:hypothetical protein
MNPTTAHCAQGARPLGSSQWFEQNVVSQAQPALPRRSPDSLTRSSQPRVDDPLQTNNSVNSEFLLAKRETEAVERA